MRMGLVPPFSDFLLEILRAYDLRLLHLTLVAILDLFVFAHACEAFVGVMPSVALFGHFFIPTWGARAGWEVESRSASTRTSSNSTPTWW